MPKLKTNRSVKKRMRISKNGKIKRFRSSRGHLLTLKSAKRRRHLGKPGTVAKGQVATMYKLLPYGA
ncbi:MAG: 50S ribosomal protein L35 [Candidatus Omnitrophota bacterium]